MSKKFKYNTRIYYEDTDAGGVVYYANYLKFLERARSEAIYSLGLSNKEILEMKKFTYNFLKSKKKIHNVDFLYGGSVNSINFHEIMNDTKVDGALIGGASLKTIEMNKILTFC